MTRISHCRNRNRTKRTPSFRYKYLASRASDLISSSYSHPLPRATPGVPLYNRYSFSNGLVDTVSRGPHLLTARNIPPLWKRPHSHARNPHNAKRPHLDRSTNRTAFTHCKLVFFSSSGAPTRYVPYLIQGKKARSLGNVLSIHGSRERGCTQLRCKRWPYRRQNAPRFQSSFLYHDSFTDENSEGHVFFFFSMKSARVSFSWFWEIVVAK